MQVCHSCLFSRELLIIQVTRVSFTSFPFRSLSFLLCLLLLLWTVQKTAILPVLDHVLSILKQITIRIPIILWIHPSTLHFKVSCCFHCILQVLLQFPWQVSSRRWDTFFFCVSTLLVVIELIKVFVCNRTGRCFQLSFFGVNQTHDHFCEDWRDASSSSSSGREKGSNCSVW